MFKKLDHNNLKVARAIHHVFQRSYSVEARILEAIDFPPLRRTVEDIRCSSTVFWACIKKEQLLSVVETENSIQGVHINSLVVDPLYFKKGYASKMLAQIILANPGKTITVETGKENGPATSLYKKFAFVEIKQYRIKEGIIKVRFSFKTGN